MSVYNSSSVLRFSTSSFLNNFVAALQTIEGNMGQGLLGALQSAGAVNVEAVLTTLINEISARVGSFVA
jgi:ATP/maltotriose-dependent transcriptional regulator MalT